MGFVRVLPKPWFLDEPFITERAKIFVGGSPLVIKEFAFHKMGSFIDSCSHAKRCRRIGLSFAKPSRIVCDSCDRQPISQLRHCRSMATGGEVPVGMAAVQVEPVNSRDQH